MSIPRSTRFERFELRTTNVPAARDFYERVLGAAFWGPRMTASALPERALALGAKPHWAGHLGVDDPLAVAARVVERGGQQLGPTLHDAAGVPCVFLRDPFGAMLALGARRDDPAEHAVTWHLLHTTDHEQALAFYVELFGWHPLEEGALPGVQGARHRTFAWDKSGSAVGSVTNAARLPAIHRQWLYVFGVTDLTRACEVVRSNGGLALEPVRSDDGGLFVAADDAQGAAFDLHQRA
jgi:predicted enzyme related to lactoylglutathione lyase